MHLIIVGAGPVGNALIRLALEHNHDVVMIESTKERAEACADRHDITVLNAQISDEGVAEEAGFDKARALIATTTDDAANLMAMFLGLEHRIPILTSTVNHSTHRKLFEKLGVHVLADPEELVARHLLDVTVLSRAHDVTTLKDKEQIIEINLGDSSKLVGLSIGEIQRQQLLDNNLAIISVGREGKDFFPRDDEVLQAGDALIIFSRDTIRPHDLDIFTES